MKPVAPPASIEPASPPAIAAPSAFSFYARHALRWLLTASLLAVFAWCLYVAVRFYHIDNHAYRLIASIVFSGDPVPGADKGLRLDTYRMDVAAREVAGVERNLSGLAFDSDNNQLIAVVNRPATLLVMDLDGKLLRSHRLRHVADVEGVAWLGQGRVALVEEGNSRIVVAAVPRSGNAELDLRDAMSLQLNLGIGDEAAQKGGNQGFEGLGYDQRRDELYVVKEHSPQALYRIGGLRGELQEGRMALRVENLTGWLNQPGIPTDLSSVEANPANGHLLLLSDETQLVVELDRNGAIAGSLPLGAVPQAEGVALGPDNTVYVVSEPNLFYRLKPRSRP